MFLSRMIFLSLVVFSVAACQSGNCRQVKTKLPKVETPEEAAKVSGPNKQELNEARTFVYKYDGSKQCGEGKPIDLKVMAKELKGIKIYSMERKPDGLMHIQVCGAPTGYANVYEIDKSNLEAAKKMGFKEWNFSQ